MVDAARGGAIAGGYELAPRPRRHGVLVLAGGGWPAVDRARLTVTRLTRLTRDAASGRLGFLFIALSAVLFGSLGVATKGIFQVAGSSPVGHASARRHRAPGARRDVRRRPGKRMFRIAAPTWFMGVAGLMMALYQAAFVVAITTRASPS